MRESEVAVDNRRDSYRLPHISGADQARLRVGRLSVECRIVDESAGGFLIAAPKFPPTPPTRPVELITAAGCHPLRVVWRRVEGQEVRIGLQRLPEEIRLHQESSWMIWMIIAVILGFGGGYVFAFKDMQLTEFPIVQTLSQKLNGQIKNDHVIPTSSPNEQPLDD